MMAAMAGFFPGFYPRRSDADALALKYSKAIACRVMECR